MSEIKYEIVQHLKVLSTNSSGWTKEINLVSWNNSKPKYDIREWDPTKEKMSKGITLNEDEMSLLLQAINEK